MKKNYNLVQQFENQKLINKNTDVVIEEPLQININGESFTITMRTPGNDLSLTVGLLHSENIISDINEIESHELLYNKDEEHPFAIVLSIPKIKKDSDKPLPRSQISNSSCGLCGKKEWEAVKFKYGKLTHSCEVNLNIINNLIKKMQSMQTLFKSTGGSHAAAIFNEKYDLISTFEDIGRHNAVDKAIGQLLLNKTLHNANILLVSGRISFEILYKAYLAKIRIILAISAPSSMCIDFAEKFGIIIIAFCRDSRATIYTGQNEIGVAIKTNEYEEKSK